MFITAKEATRSFDGTEHAEFYMAVSEFLNGKIQSKLIGQRDLVEWPDVTTVDFSLSIPGAP